jgi:hypothetical protein
MEDKVHIFRVVLTRGFHKSQLIYMDAEKKQPSHGGPWIVVVLASEVE